MAGNETAMCLRIGTFGVHTGAMFGNIGAKPGDFASMFIAFVPMFMNIVLMFIGFDPMFMNIVLMFRNIAPMLSDFDPMFMNFVLMFVNINPMFPDITLVSAHGDADSADITRRTQAARRRTVVGTPADRTTPRISLNAHPPSPAIASLHAIREKQDAGRQSHGVKLQGSPDEVSNSEAGHLSIEHNANSRSLAALGMTSKGARMLHAAALCFWPLSFSSSAFDLRAVKGAEHRSGRRGKGPYV